VLGVPLFCSRSTKANGMGTRVDLRANFSVAHLSPAQRVVNLLLNAAMQWVGVAVSDGANMYPGWRFENAPNNAPFGDRGGVGRGNARQLRG